VTLQSKRIVLYDTLLKQVELPELLAIVGHEIGHWRLWHTIQGFVITQIYIFSLFLVFSFVQQTPGLFLDFGFAYSSTSPMPVFIGLTLFMQAIWTPVEKVFLSRLNHVTSLPHRC
jgi:STE24 endopeptidase